MRKTILLFALMLGVTSFAQNNKGESNNLSVFSAPGTYIDLGDWIQPNFKNDGFNFGVNYEHQNRTIYVGSQLFIFPDLNGIDYVHLIGRFGFNKEWGRGQDWTNFRIYTGGRAGMIYREGGGLNYVMLGAEIGIQLTLPNSMFFTLAGSRNSRTDSQLWSNKDNFTTESVDAGFGIRF